MLAGSAARLTRTCIATACSLCAVAPSAASAQPDAPIGGFVVDLRGSIAPYGQNEELANPRGVEPFAVPSVGLGFEAGAHTYLYRWRAITFGAGASFHASRGSRGPQLPSTEGPTLQTSFTAVSPQISFNFGGRDGWSYLSGGIGTSRLSLRAAGDGDTPPQRRARTLNYGGGARWFVRQRLAFSLDLRFYAVSPLPPVDMHPRSPRMTLMVFNVGASFR